MLVFWLDRLLLLFLFASCQNPNDCSVNKQGDFINIVNQDTVFISRNDSIQTERYLGMQSELRVEWTDDCIYTLTLIKSDDENLKKIIGSTLKVEILKSTNKGYTFRSKGIDGLIYHGSYDRLPSPQKKRQ